jgi:hypothetical protein
VSNIIPFPTKTEAPQPDAEPYEPHSLETLFLVMMETIKSCDSAESAVALLVATTAAVLEGQDRAAVGRFCQSLRERVDLLRKFDAQDPEPA